MGENIKVKEQDSTADTLRAQIRNTEGDITKTVHNLELRLSPGNIRRRGVRQAKIFAWQGTARLLDLAQRNSVQASLLGVLGGSALLPLLLFTRKRKAPYITAAVNLTAAAKKRAASAVVRVLGTGTAATAAKAAGATGLWMILRKGREKDDMLTKKPVSGAILAATAAKAFLTGARSSKKSGTTRPGRKVAWRGLATAIGAALGSYWYSHKEHRV